MSGKVDREPVRLVKIGIPDQYDLEGLSLKLGDSWRGVARRLLIPDEQIATIDHQHKRLPDKGYAMLLHWKQMFGSEATYKTLHDALSHNFVHRQDLAQEFCLTGASDQEDNIPWGDSATDKQPLSKARASACGTSGKQRSVDEVIKPSGTTEDGGRLREESVPLSPTPRIPASTSDQETPDTVKMSFTPVGLSSEQEDVVDGLLRQQLKTFLDYNKKAKLSTANGLSAFLEHLEETYNLAVKAVGEGSLVIKAQCPDLESLESLWSDYRCGVLNEAAERFLITDEIKNKINLETLRLKTLIEKENYLNCKKALLETSGATDQEDNIPKDDSAIDEQPLSKSHAAACETSGKQRSVDEVIKPSETTEDAGRLSGVSRTPSISGSTSDQGTGCAICHPNMEPNFALMARIAMKHENYQEALHHLSKALHQIPPYLHQYAAPLLADRAECLWQLGHALEAVQDIESAISIGLPADDVNPEKEAWKWTNRGFILRKEKICDLAERYASVALRFPVYTVQVKARAFLCRALSRYELGNISGTKRDAQEVKKLDHNLARASAQTEKDQAIKEFQQHNYENALKLFQLALLLHPEDSSGVRFRRSVQSHQAAAYFKSKQYRKALEVGEKSYKSLVRGSLATH